MNVYEDAYARTFVVLYYILCVVICSFFLLNLTIAVMLMKYEEFDKSSMDNGYNMELLELGRSIDLDDNLSRFLIKQNNIQIHQKAK